MNSEPRTIEAAISQANIDAALGQFLYSIGMVQDNEKVYDIKIVDLTPENPIIKFTIVKEDNLERSA